VGDVYSVDYLGATRAGMQAILFDVAGVYRERAAKSGIARGARAEAVEDSRDRCGAGVFAHANA